MRKMSSTLSSSSHRSRNSNKEDPSPPLLDIGDTAPDFELVDHEGTKYKLSDFRGRRVLLSFFRYAGKLFRVCVCVYVWLISSSMYVHFFMSMLHLMHTFYLYSMTPVSVQCG